MEINSREFAEWAAMERIAGPTSPVRLDILMAHQTALLVNTMSSLWAKRHKRLRPEDCQVRWQVASAKRRADPAYIRHKITVWANAMNQKFKKEK